MFFTNVDGDFLFPNVPAMVSGRLSVTDVSGFVVFPTDFDLYIAPNYRLLFHRVNESVLIDGSLLVEGSFSAREVANSFVLNGSLNITGDDSFLNVSLLSGSFFVPDGIFPTGGNSYVSGVAHNLEWNSIEVINPANFTFSHVQNLTYTTHIYLSCGFQLLNFDSFFTPHLIAEDRAKDSFLMVNTLLLFRLFRDLMFSTDEFITEGTHFLFHFISDSIFLPSFDLLSGSIVHLRTIPFNVELFNITGYSGTLTLDTSNTVTIHSLKLLGPQSSRNGRDTAVVLNGVLHESGCFCGGHTISIIPALLNTSLPKSYFGGVLVTEDYLLIDVDGGKIAGSALGGIQMKSLTDVVGNVWFSNSVNTSYPIFDNYGTLHFFNATTRRDLEWKFFARNDSSFFIHDFELSLGRGGGEIDVPVNICPTCTLAFHSTLQFAQFREPHVMTSNSYLNCPNCTLEFRGNGAWLQVFCLFNLQAVHKQSFGRLEMFDSAVHPFVEFELENCEVRFHNSSLIGLDDGEDYVPHRYGLEFPHLNISGGSLEIFNHDLKLIRSIIVIDNGGHFGLTNFSYPWSTDKILVNYGYVSFNTGFPLSVSEFLLATPPLSSVQKLPCVHLLDFEAKYLALERFNHSAITGDDVFIVSHLNWTGGSIALFELNVTEVLISEGLHSRGINNGSVLNLLQFGIFGGNAPITVSDSSVLNVLQSAVLEITSSFDIDSLDSVTSSSLNNYNLILFQNSNTSFSFDLNVFHYGEISFADGVDFTILGESHNWGDYFFDDESFLKLGHNDHVFMKLLV
ncbi:hypothetical protein GEMRC1_002838 [Eukaryota sp. GEM-RC1]